MKNKWTKTGFTLIEIVISLAILSIGIVAVLSLFPVGFDAAARSTDLTKTTFFAQQKMEEIKRNGYQETPTTTSGTFSDPRFTYTATITTMSTPNLNQVTLTVSWPYKGKTCDEAFVTFIPKYKP